MPSSNNERALALAVLAIKLRQHAWGSGGPVVLKDSALTAQAGVAIEELLELRADAMAMQEVFAQWEADQSAQVRNRVVGTFVPFESHFPALAVWRKNTLDAPRSPALARAAAWEITALIAELGGEMEEARLARHEAALAVNVGGAHAGS